MKSQSRGRDGNIRVHCTICGYACARKCDISINGIVFVFVFVRKVSEVAPYRAHPLGGVEGRI